MIQAVACFAEIDHSPEASSKVMALFTPDPDAPAAEEETIIKVARSALKYIQNHSKGESKLRRFATENPDQALKVMLLWSCNSFEGGRIYEKQSRINHSCNPNSIIQADGDVQLVRAATLIHSGDEITTSYLGLLLYTDRPTRRSLLASTKHFHCSCIRCSSSSTNCDVSDPAAAIPCITCHPRDGRYLEEDVAYDDDKQVNYMYPRSSEDYECLVCNTKIPSTESDAAKQGPASDVVIVSQKVLAFLLDKETRVEEDDEADEEWEEQMNQLTCSVAGALHWTTNLVTLMRLNRLLKRQHSVMLQTGENPEPEEIAETIDMLERLCRFMNGLELNLHIGHVLSTVIIGVARTLVSLGDEKSQMYAGRWISQVKDFSDVFDSDGMQRVVKSLLEAGKNGVSEPLAKKTKTN
ncbi:SET domain-containing protein [Fragilaria crotonensis]|nr:SET domain-containing protein [Fragilaria crotonensis]